jgi:hypothetical protein
LYRISGSGIAVAAGNFESKWSSHQSNADWGGYEPTDITIHCWYSAAELPTSTIVNGCSYTIWQIKAPPEMQGRVFSVRFMIAWC